MKWWLLWNLCFFCDSGSQISLNNKLNVNEGIVFNIDKKNILKKESDFYVRFDLKIKNEMKSAYSLPLKDIELIGDGQDYGLYVDSTASVHSAVLEVPRMSSETFSLYLTTREIKDNIKFKMNK